jgi:molybdate transport system substrate-binding protein
MKIRLLVAASNIGFMFLLLVGIAAQAAEVKVLSAFGIRPVMEDLGPKFERTTGHKPAIQYGLGAALKRQIEAGETFDLAILTPPLIDDLTKQGKVAGGTRTVIARSGMGVAMRAGAPKPDISSVDAFKRALLNAKSIAYAPEGTTGIHLAKVLERLGIAEEIKAKTKPQKTPERMAQAVADGEAELGFAATSVILATPGAAVLGPFPPELQDYVVFTAVIGAAAKETEAARALIKFLTSPAAVSVIKAKGMEPVTP